MRIAIVNGTVIDTEPVPRVLAGADILIDGDVIAAVGPGLVCEADEIIDATGLLVLPGLVDAHRHVWQSVLRAIAPDTTLTGYLGEVLGRLAPAFTAADLAAANLWGALDALHSGVTTVLDWSHLQTTPDHTDAAIESLRASGIRAVFAYGFRAPGDGDPAEVRRMTGELSGDALLTPAFAAWGPVYGSPEAAVADWRLARELGLRISLHATGEGAVERLSARGLLGPDVQFVHGNGFTDAALKELIDSGATAAVSPAVELQMGHGRPQTARFRAAGVPTGLGVDTVVDVPGDLFAVMRAALTATRAESLASDSALPPASAADILRMATIEGAASIGLADRVGSLRPGKQADLLLLRTDSPHLWPLADPIAAVVTAADTGDVDTVLVAGQVMKRGGHLTHPRLAPAREAAANALGEILRRASVHRS